MSNEKIRKTPLSRLIDLHDQVDLQVEKIIRNLDEGLQCGAGCSECCLDQLTVFEVEALRIQSEYAEILKEPPEPVGACAFLGEDMTCRIYNARPYVCRTQGLPLRWFGEGPEGQIAELRDICPLNEPKVDLESLLQNQCFLLGPVEEQLREIQKAQDGGLLNRVRLRDLFQKQNQPAL